MFHNSLDILEPALYSFAESQKEAEIDTEEPQKTPLEASFDRRDLIYFRDFNPFLD